MKIIGKRIKYDGRQISLIIQDDTGQLFIQEITNVQSEDYPPIVEIGEYVKLSAPLSRVLESMRVLDYTIEDKFTKEKIDNGYNRFTKYNRTNRNDRD